MKNSSYAYNRLHIGDSQITVAILILLYLFVVVRTAWVNDDAYITFRTVDNFVNGYGLTWNVAERVQAYTHPLWMFAVSSVYFFTREAYYTSIFLSILFSLIAIIILAYKIADPGIGAYFAVVTLTLSKAYIDYSTSGLENALTHCILACFLALYFIRSSTAANLFFLSLVASLGVLNRIDTVLLFLPVIIYAFFDTRWNVKSFLAVCLGFLPVLIWELFSVFYYGFPFPNTAYAKVFGLGLEKREIIEQGFYYMMNAVDVDPITPLVIITSVIVMLFTQNKKGLPVVVGILLYLGYVVWIGGDFMSGRFLTAPFFCSVALLSRFFVVDRRELVSTIFVWAAVIVLGFSAAQPTLLSNSAFGSDMESLRDAVDHRGIADERRFYYAHTGLLRRSHSDPVPSEEWWAINGPRISDVPILIEDNVGFVGYYAGPSVHVVDPNALTDPLLARIPLPSTTVRRIGHKAVAIPDGYLETLQSPENLIADAQLASYYDKLALITRGDLLDTDRLRAIVNMNLGRYDYLLRIYGD